MIIRLYSTQNFANAEIAAWVSSKMNRLFSDLFMRIGLSSSPLLQIASFSNSIYQDWFYERWIWSLSHQNLEKRPSDRGSTASPKKATYRTSKWLKSRMVEKPSQVHFSILPNVPCRAESSNIFFEAFERKTGSVPDPTRHALVKNHADESVPENVSPLAQTARYDGFYSATQNIISDLTGFTV